jgi:AcrR family transcriptional regulator
MTGPKPSPATGVPARPSLRERNRQQTRLAILEAIAEIELTQGGMLDPSRITYARIAEIAGVSERTVYRVFPTRQDLDLAYTEEAPMRLGLEIPRDIDLESFADVIDEIGRRWGERTGHRRIEEHEIDAEDYPVSMAARRTRDDALVDQLLALLPDPDEIPDRQQRSIAAVLSSTISVRSIAITAQRWNLTIEEATRAHTWALRVLLSSIRTSNPDPWTESP